MSELDPMVARLQAWRPSMRQYQKHPAVSSGFANAVRHEGLSAAWHRRQQVRKPTPAMARGSILHACLSGDRSVTVSAPASDAQRAAEAWGLLKDIDTECNIVADDEDWYAAGGSFASLLFGQPEDTRAKEEIRRFMSWPGLAEVSHCWRPFPEEAPKLVCKIREDWIVQSDSGKWAALPIKTGARALRDRWYWRQYRFALAFYRAGLKDLFGELFGNLTHALVIGSLTAPYPWGLYDLAHRAEELDGLWYNEVTPVLFEIAEALEAGRCHGNEELGLFESAI